MWKSILAVAKRELSIWARRPIYFVGSLAVITFGTTFFLTFFKAGLPSKLPIGVVDYDNSSLSRNFTRQLDATQLGDVVRFETFADARNAMQRGDITSICVLPDNFAADIKPVAAPPSLSTSTDFISWAAPWLTKTSSR